MDDHPLEPDEEGNYLVSIPTAGRKLGLSRHYIYLLARHGYLRTIPVGQRRLVPVDAMPELVRQLAQRRVPTVQQLRATTPPIPGVRPRPPAPAIAAAAGSPTAIRASAPTTSTST